MMKLFMRDWVVRCPEPRNSMFNLQMMGPNTIFGKAACFPAGFVSMYI